MQSKVFNAAFSYSLILMGFTAMTSQIVFIRELLVAFCGNEFLIGLILASWLIWGAAGSAILGFSLGRGKSAPVLFCACQLALCLMLPLTVLMIRSIRPFAGLNPGEMVGPFTAALSSLIVLAPVSAILGFMFAVGCLICKVKASKNISGVSRVYVLESLGAVLGGVITSFVLIRSVNSVNIAILTGILNASFAILMLLFYNKTRATVPIAVISIFLCASGAIGALFHMGNKLDGYLLKKSWPFYNVIHSKNSVYGNITVTEKGREFSFFNNGLFLYAIPDKPTAEESVHFALLEHPDPKSVLLIGGGMGVAGEALKEPIERLDYVDLDPAIVRAAEITLPQEYIAPFNDKRIRIRYADGRYFIKTTDEKYDCVIINVGSPHTAEINRYYTLEFYKEIKRVLNKGGVVSFGLASSESFINNELGEFLSSIYITLRKAFIDVKVLPGPTAYFLASSEPGLLTYEYKTLIARSAGRGLRLDFVNENYLFSRLAPEKVSYLERSIRRDGLAGINRDLWPISYYYDIVSWAKYFRDGVSGRILRSINDRIITRAAFIVCVLVMASSALSMFRKNMFKEAVLLSVLTMGFSSMAYQMMILLAFQVIYGYLFYKLGMILSFFMIGLMAGAALAGKISMSKTAERGNLMAGQAAMAVYPLMLLTAFLFLAGARTANLSWIRSNIVFTLLPVVAGLIGAFQFIMVNRVYVSGSDSAGVAGGLTYGLDLAGSSLGAIITGMFLVPVIGMPKTCFMLAILNFSVLVLLMSTNVMRNAKLKRG